MIVPSCTAGAGIQKLAPSNHAASPPARGEAAGALEGSVMQNSISKTNTNTLYTAQVAVF
jgi:hypothetical protein